MESDYFLYAMARGEKKWTIIRRHGLRNIMLPALTLQFASISEIFGGSVLVEQVFSYPGLGQAAVTAGLGGDVSFAWNYSGDGLLRLCRKPHCQYIIRGGRSPDQKGAGWINQWSYRFMLRQKS